MPKFNLEDYEPVEDRLERFHKEFKEGRVVTEMVQYSEDRVVFKASLFRSFDEDKPWATGYAEETRGMGGLVNTTSHLENCETSAIGRALANAGYAPKGKRPSKEEMQKVRSRLTEVAALKNEKKVQATLGLDMDAAREIKRLYAITARLHPKAQNIGQRVMKMANDKGYESLNKVPAEVIRELADGLEQQLESK